MYAMAALPLVAALGRGGGAAAGRLRSLIMGVTKSPPPLSLQANEASISRNADPEATFVVSGASRGIGLELVRQLLERTKGHVIGMSRAPDACLELNTLKEAHERLTTVAVDLTHEPSIQSACASIAQQRASVDVLINCAGILHDNSPEHMPERSMSKCSAEWMHRVYAINAVGPVLLTAGLVPLLTKSTGTGRQRLVANLSARVGSVSDNGLGGWWGYRMSKAALNMATRNMALELGRKKVTAIALHPGTTDTGLSQPFQKNVKPEKLFTTAYTVGRLLDIINCVEPDQSGHLYAWDGQRIEP